MSTDAIKHIGSTLVHVTAASNLASIAEYGLLPAASLATSVSATPPDIALRKSRQQIAASFGTCTLNHQKPIVQAGDAPERMLEGHSRLSWANMLDARVFFSPMSNHQGFTASLARDLEMAEITISTEKLFDALPDLIDLAPINTGNFRQGGANAVRGDWIYVPLTAGWTAFRHNRRDRGLVQNADTVREVSLRGPIPPDILSAIRLS